MQFGMNVADRKVGLLFDEFPQQLRSVLLARIAGLTGQLYASVQAAAPRGATGKLSRSIAMRVENEADYIRGAVFVSADFAKAAALEYGAHKGFTVKAHEQRLTHVFGEEISPESVEVAAYQRHANIAERRFLRGPLAAMEPEIMAALEEAVTGAVNEAAAA